MTPPNLKIKKRTEWRINRSIIAGRSTGGQIIWRGRSDIGAADVFLLRVGKDAGRQMVGSRQKAVRELEKLRLELEAGTYTPPDPKIKFDTFLKQYYLRWKYPSLKPHTYGL